VEHNLPLALVCRLLGASRSTIYARLVGVAELRTRPGPPTSISDAELLGLIRQVLEDSPFAGEGYRKIRARLRRQHGMQVSGKRVLRLLRSHRLLAPQRARGRRKPRPHDGTIIPEAPNLRWGTDATMAWTRSDGWVWVFCVVDHYSAEAWAHVAKIGDRFAALQPVYDAVIDRWGRPDADVARGLSLRHDWGPQYRSPGVGKTTVARRLVTLLRRAGVPAGGFTTAELRTAGRREGFLVEAASGPRARLAHVDLPGPARARPSGSKLSVLLRRS
jgi:hypothetical protein